MRNPENLDAYKFADELAFAVYKATEGFPSKEQFGLTQQIRRAAVSVPSNIVEGCSRHTEADYIRFLDIAYGSLKELRFQLSLADRLGYLDRSKHGHVPELCERTSRILAGLITSLRRQPNQPAKSIRKQSKA